MVGLEVRSTAEVFVLSFETKNEGRWAGGRRAERSLLSVFFFSPPALMDDRNSPMWQ